MSKGRILRIELYGGLGNQLLIYIAGLALAQSSSRSLEIDFFWRDSIHSVGYDITSFKLYGNVRRRNLTSFQRQIVKFTWRVKDSLSHRFSIFKYFEYKYLGVFREILSLNSISGLDLNKLLNSDKRRVTLKGYFFSNKYFLSLVDTDLSTIELVSPTLAFLNLQAEMKKTEPIVIHLRKWEGNIGDFGQLSENFFLKALTALRDQSLVNDEPIWLFVENKSDLSLFPRLEKLANMILTPSELPDPAETLLLMSMSHKLIMSNSTFSYCAGLLSDVQRTGIYAPWPFRPTPNPISKKDILLNHWTSIESEWL